MTNQNNPRSERRKVSVLNELSGIKTSHKKYYACIILMPFIFIILSSLASSATIISTCQGAIATAGQYELNQSIIRATTANCLVPTVNGVEIDCKGFEINMTTISGYAAIHAQNKNGTVIKNCVINNASYGILVDRGFNVTIFNNTFDGTLLTASTQTAISAFGGNTIIENNTFILHKYHIYATVYSGGVTTPTYIIKGNVMDRPSVSAIFNDASSINRFTNSIIEDNIITSNVVNFAQLYLAAGNGDNVTIRRNRFYINNTGTASGVWIKNISNLIIDNNDWGNESFRALSSSAVFSLLVQGGKEVLISNNRVYTYNLGGLSAQATTTAKINFLTDVVIQNNTIDTTGNISWGIGCGGDGNGLLSNVTNCTVNGNTIRSVQRLNTGIHGIVIVWVTNATAQNNYVNGTYQGAVLKGINGTCLIKNNEFYYAYLKNLFDKHSHNCVFEGNTLGYSSTYEAYVGNDGDPTLFARNSTWINNRFISSTARYVFGTDYNSTVTIVNMTYADNNESVCIGCNLTRKWFYNPLIKDTSGNALSGSTVEAISSNGLDNQTRLTDISGRTALIQITDYVSYSGTRTYYALYNITASLSGFISNSTTLNATYSNNIFDQLIFLTAQPSSQSEQPQPSGGWGSGGTTPNYLNLTKKLCELTYPYAGNKTYNKIDDIISIYKLDTGVAQSWTNVREIIDKWQVYCAPLTNRTLEEKYVCTKLYYLMLNNHGDVNLVKLNDLRNNMKSTIDIPLSVLQNYMFNYNQKCYLEGLSDKIPLEYLNKLTLTANNTSSQICDLSMGNDLLDSYIPLGRWNFGENKLCENLEGWKYFFSFEYTDNNYYLNGIKLYLVLIVMIILVFVSLVLITRKPKGLNIKREIMSGL